MSDRRDFSERDLPCSSASLSHERGLGWDCGEENGLRQQRRDHLILPHDLAAVAAFPPAETNILELSTTVLPCLEAFL